jgi:hypothetical protein
MKKRIKNSGVKTLLHTPRDEGDYFSYTYRGL